MAPVVKDFHQSSVDIPAQCEVANPRCQAKLLNLAKAGWRNINGRRDDKPIPWFACKDDKGHNLPTLAFANAPSSTPYFVKEAK
jgi:hypothetical protein